MKNIVYNEHDMYVRRMLNSIRDGVIDGFRYHDERVSRNRELDLDILKVFQDLYKNEYAEIFGIYACTVDIQPYIYEKRTQCYIITYSPEDDGDDIVMYLDIDDELYVITIYRVPTDEEDIYDTFDSHGDNIDDASCIEISHDISRYSPQTFRDGAYSAHGYSYIYKYITDRSLKAMMNNVRDIFAKLLYYENLGDIEENLEHALLVYNKNQLPTYEDDFSNWKVYVKSSYMSAVSTDDYRLSISFQYDDVDDVVIDRDLVPEVDTKSEYIPLAEFLQKEITGNRHENMMLISSAIIMYTLYTDKPYNIYRFSSVPSDVCALTFTLIDHVGLLALELFLFILESHGVIVRDSPGFREYISDIAVKEGIVGSHHSAEKFYESYDDIYVDITHTIYATERCDNDLVVFIKFMEACRPYVYIENIISSIYKLIHKYRNHIISDAYDPTHMQYIDVLPYRFIDDFEGFANDVVLEYISEKIKAAGLFKFSFYEYIGVIDIKGSSDKIKADTRMVSTMSRIFKNSDIDENTIMRLFDGEDYNDIKEEMIRNGRLQHISKQEK